MKRSSNRGIMIISSFTLDDIIYSDYTQERRLGGPAYYASIAVRKMMLRPIVVTSVGKELKTLTDSLGITLCAITDEDTFRFEIVYHGESRLIRLLSKGRRIPLSLIAFCIEKYKDSIDAIIISPVYDEVTIEHLLYLHQVLSEKRLDITVAVDLQGFLRSNGVRILDETRGLIDVIHVEEQEALSNQLCPSYYSVPQCSTLVASKTKSLILYTRGEKGSSIALYNRVIRVPVYGPFEGDPTGAGDIYLAGFTAATIIGHDIMESALIASVLAGLSVKGALDEVSIDEIINTATRLRSFTLL